MFGYYFNAFIQGNKDTEIESKGVWDLWHYRALDEEHMKRLQRFRKRAVKCKRFRIAQ